MIWIRGCSFSQVLPAILEGPGSGVAVLADRRSPGPGGEGANVFHREGEQGTLQWEAVHHQAQSRSEKYTTSRKQNYCTLQYFLNLNYQLIPIYFPP